MKSFEKKLMYRLHFFSYSLSFLALLLANNCLADDEPFLRLEMNRLDETRKYTFCTKALEMLGEAERASGSKISFGVGDSFTIEKELGPFVGKGNATYIFLLHGVPNKVIRIPFPGSIRAGGRALNRVHLHFDYVRSWPIAVAVGLPVVQMHEAVGGLFAIVDLLPKDTVWFHEIFMAKEPSQWLKDLAFKRAWIRFSLSSALVDNYDLHDGQVSYSPERKLFTLHDWAMIKTIPPNKEGNIDATGYFGASSALSDYVSFPRPWHRVWAGRKLAEDPTHDFKPDAEQIRLMNWMFDIARYAKRVVSEAINQSEDKTAILDWLRTMYEPDAIVDKNAVVNSKERAALLKIIESCKEQMFSAEWL